MERKVGTQLSEEAEHSLVAIVPGFSSNKSNGSWEGAAVEQVQGSRSSRDWDCTYVQDSGSFMLPSPDTFCVSLSGAAGDREAPEVI